MEHLMKLSGSVPCLSLNPLGSFHNNRYYINDECLINLNEICNKLRSEDPNTRPFRRAIGFLDVLNKDLIPILVGNKDQPEIFYSTIKLLVELTVPIEGLICTETSKRTASKNIVIHEIEQLLYSAKEAFLDGRATLAVLRHLHHLLEQRTLSSDENKCLNDSLALIYNVLHVPERHTNEHSNVKAAGVEATGETVAQQPTGSISSRLHQLHSNGKSYGIGGRQSRLMWNLFTQGLDRILITSLTKSEKNDWIANIVRLMSFIYKDHYMEEMEKLVDTCILTYKEAEPDGDSNDRPLLIDSFNSQQFLNFPCDQPCLIGKSCAALTRGLQPTMILSPTIRDPVTRKTGCNKRHKVSGETECLSTVTSSLHGKRSNKSEHYSQSNTSSKLFLSDARCKQGNRWMTHSRKRKYLGLRRQGNSEKSDKTFKSNIVPAALSIPGSAKQNAETYIMRKDDTEAAEELSWKSCKCNRETGRFIKMKVLQHMPTKEDISHLLADFLIDFLLNGYNTLVGHLHQQLLQQKDAPSLLEEAPFLWLISYFLPFISKLKLDVGRFTNVFTIDLLCFLTWEVVHQEEVFEMNSMQPTKDVEPCLRRLHLGVKAICEYLQIFKVYSSAKKGSTPINELQLGNRGEKFLFDLRSYLPAVRDLRQLFLLQLRHFNPTIQNRQHLRNVIATNHILLLELERAAKQSPLVAKNFDLHQHLDQFCTETIVNRYGIALEDFRTNSTFVNDCILTLLHHVGVDLDRVDLLCEQGILRSFRDIWEEDLNICDDWKDLIEYVIRKFLRNYQTSGHFHMGSPSNRSNGPWYPQDSLSGESEHFETSKLYRIVETGHSSVKNDATVTEVHTTKTELLIAQLIDSGFRKQLDWIRSSLLTACSARLGTYAGQEFRHPITCLSLQMNMSCPIVPWTEVEASALRSETFLYLLDRVGLFPCCAHDALYPRIPREWSADTVLSVALIFGPVNQEMVDFDLSLCKKN
ncbi:LOW QUALITY PROTEIN: protein timeless-like [Daphnia carinata]|uniref:LOW QUALITY PROTEIN: protein timeless-like n=1 Tax=Daphnia carinata TaxID=120202 RepID=UPI0028697CED|nr:LOW QUALITY PROTEIN: protein timeless-like [Daphnia carinata]